MKVPLSMAPGRETDAVDLSQHLRFPVNQQINTDDIKTVSRRLRWVPTAVFKRK